MKKVMALFLCVGLIFPLAFASNGEGAIDIDAKGAVLTDLSTGMVLYEKDANKKLNIASVTKIMSLLLICEAVEEGKISLEDKVSASENAVSFGGSQIWLEIGEEMSVDELLKAVCVASANDACTALGEFVAGSSEAFVKQMNEKARKLGMKNTRFENCTGLDEDTKNHFSTAYDVALMSAALMKYDLIKKYSVIWMDSLRAGKTELVNTNRLVRDYKGCTGLKTGTTSKAGFCVSATAQSGNTQLCAVVLGSENSKSRFAAAAKLLDWGFANYETVHPAPDLAQAGAVPVKGGNKSTCSPVINDEVSLTMKKGEYSKAENEILLTKELTAPVKKGQTVGKINFYSGGKIIGTVNIVSGEDIEKLGFFSALGKMFKSLVC